MSGGRAIAPLALAKASGGRKVRAPTSKMVDNVDRSQGQGKCNRKDTAGPQGFGKGEMVG
jgi:hypothetical protein